MPDPQRRIIMPGETLPPEMPWKKKVEIAIGQLQNFGTSVEKRIRAFATLGETVMKRMDQLELRVREIEGEVYTEREGKQHDA